MYVKAVSRNYGVYTFYLLIPGLRLKLTDMSLSELEISSEFFRNGDSFFTGLKGVDCLLNGVIQMCSTCVL